MENIAQSAVQGMFMERLSSILLRYQDELHGRITWSPIPAHENCFNGIKAILESGIQCLELHKTAQLGVKSIQVATVDWR